jgi:transposase InsO family protein
MHTDYPLSVLCAAFGVSRSGYYAWQSRPPCPRQQTDAVLIEQMHALFAHSRATYGSPRLHAALRQTGTRTSRKRVARLMRQQRWCGRPSKRFVPRTTDSNHDQPIASNQLAAEPPPQQPGRVWVSDITYVPTAEGWLYVAGVLDLYSRRLVGWAFGESLDTSLPLAALRLALSRQPAQAEGLHHSDRGSQYASAAYRGALAAAGLRASMSRRACCHDNAAMESFWSTLKNELVHRTNFSTRAQAQAALFEWIEVFYNRQRLHSALGYKSPVDYENQNN